MSILQNSNIIRKKFPTSTCKLIMSEIKYSGQIFIKNVSQAVKLFKDNWKHQQIVQSSIISDATFYFYTSMNLVYYWNNLKFLLKTRIVHFFDKKHNVKWVSRKILRKLKIPSKDQYERTCRIKEAENATTETKMREFKHKRRISVEFSYM